MCDYSLQAVVSRPARKGERLTTHDFGTHTNGFRSADDRTSKDAAAVCILPGTELAFDKKVTAPKDATPWPANVNGEQRLIGQQPKVDARRATFIQVDKDEPNTHHDALEFSDGAILLLAYLEPGLTATVLNLPARPTNDAEAKAQERVPVAG